MHTQELENLIGEHRTDAAWWVKAVTELDKLDEELHAQTTLDQAELARLRVHAPWLTRKNRQAARLADTCQELLKNTRTRVRALAGNPHAADDARAAIGETTQAMRRYDQLVRGIITDGAWLDIPEAD